MKTIALTSLESQAPDSAPFNPEPNPAALDAAAERLELLRVEIETQASRHWQHGEDADGMAGWLKAAALKLAIRTLQARLDVAGVALFRPVSFDYARRVLWDTANEWAEIAGIALVAPDPETHGSALTNAAALRYAAQLLSGEVPATAMQLAA
jgi:hypothetical protein